MLPLHSDTHDPHGALSPRERADESWGPPQLLDTPEILLGQDNRGT